jgi:DedD protein
MESSEPGLPVVAAKEAMDTKRDSIDRLQQVALKDAPALAGATLIPAPANVPTDTKAIGEPSNQQDSLASKPAKPAAKEEMMTRSAAQVLQGFVIQLAFGDMHDARRWAETLERRGFAVSLTEAGSSGSVRVRIGSFAGREEAEKQLQALRQDGLKGILVNLPQAYRPQVQPVATEAEPGDKTVSSAQ